MHTFEDATEMGHPLILEHVASHLSNFLALSKGFQSHLGAVSLWAPPHELVEGVSHPLDASIGGADV